MSIDRRMRQGLQSEASGIDVETMGALAIVQARAVRATRRVRAVQAAAAAMVLAALILLTPLGLARLGGEDRRITPVAPVGLEGAYVVDVATTAQTRRERVEGRWVVTLEPSGVVDLSAPEGVVAIAGGSYRVEDDVVRTSVLVDRPGCQASGRALGIYRWSRVRGGVRFTIVSDDCNARVLLFTNQDWKQLP